MLRKKARIFSEATGAPFNEALEFLKDTWQMTPKDKKKLLK